MSEANAGVGWYEVIHPVAATTEIVRVMEDGSIYCPEGVLTRTEFAFAAARGNAHLLVRADDLAAHDEQVRAEERERIFTDLVERTDEIEGKKLLTRQGSGIDLWVHTDQSVRRWIAEQWKAARR